MTLPTTAHLPVAQRTVQPFLLRHTTEQIDNVQRRFSSRTVLVPTVNLDEYTFRAVIDWIEFEMHFGRSTQVQHVQNVLRRFLSRNSFISPMDKAPGGVFSSCAIKVQEPSSLALIGSIHEGLVKAFGEAMRSRVTALEVSVDATPTSPSYMARARLLGALQRTIWTNRDIWSDSMSRPRSANGRGSQHVYKLSPAPEMDDTALDRSFPENHKAPLIDGTMYLGAKGDDVMIRVMDKVKDRQRPDGSFDALTEDKKRVRIEVTLRGKELLDLGVTDVQSLKHLSLTRTQGRYFKFRLPTFTYRAHIRTGADSACNERQRRRAQTYLHAGVTALMTMDTLIAANQRPLHRDMNRVLRLLKPGHTPTSTGQRLAPSFLSWKALSRKVHLALKELDQRDKRAWRRAGRTS